MKNLSKFAFLLFTFLSLFFFNSCASNMHLGMYHYTRLPSTDQSRTVIYPVYIDKDYGEADQILIAEALDQWNYAMNGNAKFEIVSTTFDMDSNAFYILKITSSNPIVSTADHVVNGVEHFTDSYSLGFTLSIGAHTVYLVRDRIRDSYMVKGLIMHEIGHALGSPHHDGGLMNPRFDAEMFQCVDYDTAVSVAQYHGWQVSSMNYCVLGTALIDGKHSDKMLTANKSGKDQKSWEPAVDIVGR